MQRQLFIDEREAISLLPEDATLSVIMIAIIAVITTTTAIVAMPRY